MIPILPTLRALATDGLDPALADVIARAADEIERLRTAVRVAQGALLECSPCASPECQAVQHEWLEDAIAGCGRALNHEDE